MEKIRVKKDERYWYVVNDCDGVEVEYAYDDYTRTDKALFELGNYFTDRDSAESMARKLRAVLKGADVIEMPSEEEISRESDYSAHKMDIDDGETPNSGLYWRGWGDAIRWTNRKS